MHFFYVLYSSKTDKFYSGSSHDPELRLKLHNDGATPSTKSGIPWKLVYFEKYDTKTEALIREKEIKRMKSRNFIISLIDSIL